MTQRYRILNVTEGTFLEPSLLGSPNVFSGFYNHSAAMGAFIELLSGAWAGDRVVIIGDQTQDDELPESVSMTGVPASKLYEVTKGNRAYVAFDHPMRKTLAEHYHYDFTVTKTETTRVAFGGEVTTVDTNVHSSRPDAATIRQLLREDAEPVVVINNETRQYLRPAAFGHGAGAGLAALVLNPSNTARRRTDPGLGLLPTALAFLVSPSLSGANRMRGVAGEWALDPITVISADTVENTPGCVDISEKVVESMRGDSGLAFRLDRALSAAPIG